jgi:glycosyltransferase involved in cell wall biosynthesis
MQIINIVDRLDKVNYGIWQAAISTANILHNQYNVKTELWYPEDAQQLPDYQYGNVKLVPVSNDIPVIETPDQTIVITHGCWQYPSRWGFALHNRGIKWIYTPHGMLEPWSMNQKWIKKVFYFNFVEKTLSRQADLVRAVGKPEYDNLKTIFKNVMHIPNGCKSRQFRPKDWNMQPLQFLFMARLHKKKGIMPLIEAWRKSILNNNSKFKLIIAGPDDGELNSVKKMLEKGSVNIEYVGLAYGEIKENLLQNSHFYLLPSFSEGFPTSVVEAMQYGLVPIISDGCNFPEAFDNKLAFKVTPDTKSILNVLDNVAVQTPQYLNELSERASSFISQNYSLEKISQMQYDLYCKLLKNE